VLQILGLRAEPQTNSWVHDAYWDGGWDENECTALQMRVAARRPFLDFVVHRTLGSGQQQQFRISGKPLLDPTCRFVGYCGTGVEVMPVG
jgi:hypothetical protein